MHNVAASAKTRDTREASARPYIGGQAVLEGVMMRAPSSFAVVVRRQDGSLVVRERAIADTRKGWRSWPLARGVMALVESLRLGSEALKFSGDQLEDDLRLEEEARATASAPEVTGSKKKGKNASAASSTLSTLAVALGYFTFLLASLGDEPLRPSRPSPRGAGERGFSGSGALMAIVAIAFFVAIPQIVAGAISKAFGLDLAIQDPRFQVITGVVKLCVVVGYLLGIRRIPEIRRVFQYHGAEHKAISTYEARESLTVANAKAKTTLHPRCGTTFLVMVALVSVAAFSVLGAAMPRIETGRVVLDHVVFFFEKLPLLPVIAAVTFELQRVFSRYCTTGPLRALLWPGFAVQKITTIEPDASQLEVALGALRATLFREEGNIAGDDVRQVRFPTYADLLGATTLAEPSREAA